MEMPKQKPKVATPEESFDIKRNGQIEQTRGEIGKSESKPTQQQRQLTPNEQKLAELKKSLPQKYQSTPTTKPPSASL